VVDTIPLMRQLAGVTGTRPGHHRTGAGSIQPCPVGFNPWFPPW